MEKFAKFPIATSFDEKSLSQPRLILVTVDIAESLPVVFDSYKKEDGSRKSEYGNYIVVNGKEVGYKHIIRYDEGITSEQVIASASVPLNSNYAQLEVESYNPNLENHEKRDTGNIKDNYTKSIRYFWDGGILSNTPLYQLVAAHREHWLNTKGLEDTVPRLEIGVINVHPTKQEKIPWDHDAVINRNNDITFSDRTTRDEQVLLAISDYIDLGRKLIKIAKDNGVKIEIINNLLNENTINHGKAMAPRKYRDMLVGQFDIGTIVRINRKNDENTISDKTFDFSRNTIKQLRESGYRNTLDLTDVDFGNFR